MFSVFAVNVSDHKIRAQHTPRNLPKELMIEDCVPMSVPWPCAIIYVCDANNTCWPGRCLQKKCHINWEVSAHF